VGSMISVHFSKTPVLDLKTASLGNNKRFRQFFHGMLEAGIYIPPSAFESWFITDALTYEDLNYTISAIKTISKSL
jgi:glutamate-1-semialdehyde 2,1-aminomutase